MYIELGKLVGVWGVKGWLKLHSYTRVRSDIANYQTWWLQKDATKQPEPIKVLNCRVQGQGIVAQLEGVDDREQANSMIGAAIFIPKSELPKLDDGEFYWQQLIGLKVLSSQPHVPEIGVVKSILETGANDVLVVTPPSIGEHKSAPEVLIPYVDSVVLEIDLQAGTLLADWDPNYLLES